MSIYGITQLKLTMSAARAPVQYPSGCGRRKAWLAWEQVLASAEFASIPQRYILRHTRLPFLSLLVLGLAAGPSEYI